MKKYAKLLLSGALLALTPMASSAQTFDLSKQQPTYSDATGYGYDLTDITAAKGNKSFFYSVKIPDGNYLVKVTLGSKKKAGSTVVRAEARRLLLEETKTKKGELKTVEFVLNKRSPEIDSRKSVKLKPREKNGHFSWDDRLTLEFTGSAPVVSKIEVTPDNHATTLFLCGNSTVVDQAFEPYASWGQMIPRWFNTNIAISNQAESGLTAGSFIAQNRLDKVLSMMKKGDYVFCEFGHNDQKEHRPGDGAWYNFVHNLKIFIDNVRKKGGNIVFITPTQRRKFDSTNTKIEETHGDYPDAMRAVAKREKVPVIELHDMTRTFFETLGYENSTKALVHYPANTYPGQTKALADNTHFNPYGAYEVAKMVVMGMKQLDLPIVKDLRPDWKDYSPAQPDDFTKFVWYTSVKSDVTKPDGN